MKARSLTATFLLAASLGGCSDSEPIPPEEGTNAPIGELPERRATVSGVVYDPEAFFLTVLNFPGEETPPPALFEDTPYLLFSAIPGATVRLAGSGGSAVSSGASSFAGIWQVEGVPLDATTPYLAEAIPPAGPVEFFTEGAPFPLPPATHYPTTYLRPIQVNVNECTSQTAPMVGSAGALDAVAQYLTGEGTPTTVEQLLDPARTGGVVLFWVHPPSFFYDYFVIPLDSVVGETSAGTLLSVNWAPPGVGPPGQSPMGFFASPDPTGFFGYYALVLPPGLTTPVTVTFRDTYVPAPEEPAGPYPRPLVISPVTVQPRPGVSVQRVFAYPDPNLPAPPVDPLEDLPPPPLDERWLCQP
ncbi:hypothetical protein [Myxococcus qinghaiensis]|uniref:hypothetical protein n=1 Tax=Myxococcus qinghaiensis TaxID=2906758 RepID=UPI0020A70023|nr:hypothetical protein [Myxococcus qinghaiensis]MCP3168321.1 hypothetical protein [Myxococcus qinghaiensis]